MLFAAPKVLQRSERGRFRDFNRVHTGGSAQFIVGYEKRGGQYVYMIQNSWGDGWCMYGRIWVSEGFLGQATDLNAIAVRRVTS